MVVALGHGRRKGGCHVIEKICWTILALVHTMPALAFFRPALISSLYGVAPADNSFLLLHHRAALFLAVLVMCLWAIFDPAVRRMVFVATAISMISFLALYWLAGAPAALRVIAIADLVGLPPLIFVGWQAVVAGRQ